MFTQVYTKRKYWVVGVAVGTLFLVVSGCSPKIKGSSADSDAPGISIPVAANLSGYRDQVIDTTNNVVGDAATEANGSAANLGF